MDERRDGHPDRCVPYGENGRVRSDHPNSQLVCDPKLISREVDSDRPKPSSVKSAEVKASTASDVDDNVTWFDEVGSTSGENTGEGLREATRELLLPSSDPVIACFWHRSMLPHGHGPMRPRSALQNAHSRSQIRQRVGLTP